MSTDRPSQYLHIAMQAARKAGPLLVRYMGRPASVHTKRSAIDLVTEVDRASERILHNAIRRRLPDHGFRGEEHTRTNPQAPYQWLVDPIDGTTNFVHGVPVFAISIALLHHHQPVVGVVYDPTRQEMFTAIKRRGAWLNGKRMHASATRRIAAGLLSTGFSQNFRRNPKPFLRWFTTLQMHCHAVRRMGCTALSLSYVACGREDGFYEQDLWPWDIAAGLLLVEEAGGTVTDFRGRPVQLEEGEVAASNGHLHRQLLALLARSS